MATVPTQVRIDEDVDIAYELLVDLIEILIFVG